MKWTIPSFFVVIIGSIPFFIYLKFTNLGALYGNLANIAGLSFAFYNYLYLSSERSINPQLKTVWSKFGLGAFLWLLGQTIETYCELILRLVTYGTVADSLWLLGYAPIMLGLHRILVMQMNEKNYGWTRFRNLLIPLGILYIVIFVFFIQQQLIDQNQPIPDRILDFCYPTMDFILIVQCVLLMKLSDKNGTFYSFSFLSGVAFALTLVGDAVLSRVQDFQSFFYLTIDIWYFSCYFLMAIAANLHARRLKQTRLAPTVEKA